MNCITCLEAHPKIPSLVSEAIRDCGRETKQMGEAGAGDKDGQKSTQRDDGVRWDLRTREAKLIMKLRVSRPFSVCAIQLRRKQS